MQRTQLEYKEVRFILIGQSWRKRWPTSCLCLWCRLGHNRKYLICDKLCLWQNCRNVKYSLFLSSSSPFCNPFICFCFFLHEAISLQTILSDLLVSTTLLLILSFYGTFCWLAPVWKQKFSVVVSCSYFLPRGFVCVIRVIFYLYF